MSAGHRTSGDGGRLRILGCRAGSPTPDSPCSGYLLETPTGRLLVDCGPGIAARLAADVGRAAVDAVVITHVHADHSLDLVALAYALQFPHPRGRRVPLWLPADSLDRVAMLDEVYGIPTLPDLARPIATAFDPQPLVLDGSTVHEVLPGVQLTAHAARHAVPSAALSIRCDGATVAFSSDTGWADGVVAAATGADLFVCEATYATATPEELETHGHLTGELAGRLAREAGVRSLLLTHLADPEDAPVIVEQARASSALPSDRLALASPGKTFSL